MAKDQGAKKPRDVKGGVQKVARSVMPAVANLATGNVGGALREGLKAIPGVVSGIRDMVNHPEWYTHYSDSNLVNLNLANKQGTVYPQTQFAHASIPSRGVRMPSVAMVGIQLTTPKGDLQGWKAGIRLLYQQLRTANSGRINYSITDLEKYIQNTRVLVAFEAYLHRLYRATYTFRSTNALYPQNLLYAMGVNPDNMLANAADLFMYVQRWSQRINVNFPLAIDYYERTRWLFNNVFADSNSEKPNVYVPFINMRASGTGDTRMGGVFIYVHLTQTESSNWQRLSTWQRPVSSDAGLTYSQLTTQLSEIMDHLLNDQWMSMIAGDIIKAFGDKAFRNYAPPKIDDAIAFVYDERVLNQLQNATVLCFTDTPSTLSDAAPNYLGKILWNANNTNYNEYPSLGNDSLATVPEGEWISSDLECTPTGESGSTQIDEAIQERFLEKYNAYLLNWHRNTITSGEIMSISRFVVSDAKFQSTNVLDFGVYGTEVVVKVAVLFKSIDYATGVESPVNPNEFEWFPIAGALASTNTDSIGAVLGAQDMRMFLWGMFDWAPRFYSIAGTDEAPADYMTADILDWDVYGETDARQVATYYSYGNQSLLYVGASQNQSNAAVYLKAAGVNVTDQGSKRESATYQSSRERSSLVRSPKR